MARLFLALVPTPSSRSEFARVARECCRAAFPSSLPDFRFVRPDQIHLTLCFFADQTAVWTEQLVRVLEAEIPSFVLPNKCLCDKVGLFPPRGVARVLWLGPGASEQSASIVQFHGSLTRILEEKGLRRVQNDKGFVCHFTVARVRKRVGSALSSKQLRTTLESVSLPQVEVAFESLALIESRLDSSGATYVKRWAVAV